MFIIKKMQYYKAPASWADPLVLVPLLCYMKNHIMILTYSLKLFEKTRPLLNSPVFHPKSYHLLWIDYVLGVIPTSKVNLVFAGYYSLLIPPATSINITRAIFSLAI